MAHKLKQRSPRRNQPPANGRPPELKSTAQDQEAIRQALHRLYQVKRRESSPSTFT
jgi:hypothetical protein